MYYNVIHMNTLVKDTTITMRVPDRLNKSLDKYAKSSGRSKSYVAHDAIEEYLSWRIPQLEDLKVSIKAADSGSFATQKEVDSFFKKYL